MTQHDLPDAEEALEALERVQKRKYPTGYGGGDPYMFTDKPIMRRTDIETIRNALKSHSDLVKRNDRLREALRRITNGENDDVPERPNASRQWMMMVAASALSENSGDTK